jgi:hypothetical protein
MAVITTTCSECAEDVVLRTAAGTVTVAVASNGRRGSLHVPAHTVTSDLSGDDDLYEWECPACGHPDSFDPNA